MGPVNSTLFPVPETIQPYPLSPQHDLRKSTTLVPLISCAREFDRSGTGRTRTREGREKAHLKCDFVATGALAGIALPFWSTYLALAQ